MSRQSSKHFPHINTLNPSQSTGNCAAEEAEDRVRPVDSELQGSEQRGALQSKVGFYRERVQTQAPPILSPGSCQSQLITDTNQIMSCPCRPSEGRAMMPSTVSPWQKCKAPNPGLKRALL